LKGTGEQVDLTIQDIVDAEGNRCPDPDHTQKSFRQAIVLVTAPGQTAAQVSTQVAELELMMATWEFWWSDRMDKVLTLCMSLNENCNHVDLSIGFGEVDDDDGVVELGEVFNLVFLVSAKNGLVKNAVACV